MFNFKSKKDKKTVAFFCMEYGIEDEIPLYAGGLGILAGDMVREAGQEDDFNLIAFGLMAHKGVKTADNIDWQKDYFDRLSSSGLKKTMIENGPLVVAIPVGDNKSILAEVWEKSYGSAKLYLLDTHTSANQTDLEDRHTTDYIYTGEKRTNIYQELILGIGGVKILDVLKIVPDIYHFNEGHAAFGALGAILQNPKARDKKSWGEKLAFVKNSLVGTKHTILPLAGSYITKDDFKEYVGTYIEEMGCSVEDVYAVGMLERDQNIFSTTKFLMTVISRSNAVSVAHAIAEKKQYPESPLMSITNGVNVSRWQSTLFESNLWKTKDETLSKIKKELRSELVSYVNEITGSKLSPDILTIVWARRFAGYKRPGLFFNNLSKLLALVSDETKPIQIVVAGKANPSEREGMEALELVKKISSNPDFRGRVTYLSHYSIRVAKILVKGADVWLNTPIPGFEACGTSGMKAGLNGGILMSTDDGWVYEESLFKDIGVMLGEEDIQNKIYELLKEKIVNVFYDGEIPGRNPVWLHKMRETINLLALKYNTKRMLRDYKEKLYEF